MTLPAEFNVSVLAPVALSATCVALEPPMAMAPGAKCEAASAPGDCTMTAPALPRTATQLDSAGSYGDGCRETEVDVPRRIRDRGCEPGGALNPHGRAREGRKVGDRADTGVTTESHSTGETGDTCTRAGVEDRPECLQAHARVALERIGS